MTLTTVESTANGGNDDLGSEESAHSEEDIPVLLVDGVDSDDMDDGAGGQEDGRADRLEEEETGALLKQGRLAPSFFGRRDTPRDCVCSSRWRGGVG